MHVFSFELPAIIPGVIYDIEREGGVFVIWIDLFDIKPILPIKLLITGYDAICVANRCSTCQKNTA